MKEATGELNMTVVTVVAIAALVAIFYAFIWPVIQANMALTSACSSAGQQEFHMQYEKGGTIDCDGVKCTINDAPGLGVNGTTKNCNN